MNFLEELEFRGLVKDVTDYEGLKERMKEPMTIYCGFDPTADSLHVGHMQQIILLKRWQNAGHRPLALVGGATGMIGDPRPTTERKLLTLEELAHNVECIKEQLSRFIDFNAQGGAVLVNNYDWLGNLNILDFLREYGKHFNVSYMLNKDTVSKRLETGISFTEFSYTILQSIDWLNLHQKHNCVGQIGGSDQWGNLTSGSELIRKILGPETKVFGITSPLITKSDGSKFGKSEGKNIWLDPNRTNAYEFYQFWINTPDVDVIDYLKRLSFISVDEILALEKDMQENAHLRNAQKALAADMTMMCHGEEGLKSAIKISETLFGQDFKSLTYDELKMALGGMNQNPIVSEGNIVDVLVDNKICGSKREAREFVNNGSISLNGEKVSDLELMITKDNALFNEFTIIRKGKKNYFVLTH
ncbi:MAG: tyrosine--tRNA ligase [Erysipelotrichaceae bacterium]